MRVAIVYDCFFPASTGGGERVYRAIADELVGRGHSVDYVTRDVDVVALEVPAGIRILPVWKGDIYDASGVRRIGPALRFAWAAARQLRRARGRYDLVIASALPVLTLIASRLALLGSGTRVVGDWLEVWGWRKWVGYSGVVAGTLAWVLQAVAARSTSRHTANSAFTAARLRAYGARDPIVLGLVDLVETHAPSAEPAAHPRYVLAVGRHIDDKQLDRLPAVIAEARSRGCSVRAVIAGSGPQTATIAEAITRHDVGDLVTLVGRVSDAELTRLYRGATAMVLPSRREGFGLVVAEAASHGVPSVVVAGADNAAVELIDRGVNGEVAESVSAHDLAGAIITVVEAGDAMRHSTAEWFARARVERGLSRSLDALIARWGTSGRS